MYNTLEAASGLLAVFSLILLVFVILVLFSYIMTGIGLKRLADKDGVPNSFLSFVPIGWVYIMVALAKDSFYMFGKKIENPTSTFFVAFVAVSILDSFALNSGSPIVIFIGVALLILDIIMSYYLYANFFKRYKGNDVTGITLACIIIPLVSPIVIFCMRNEIALDNYEDDTDYDNTISDRTRPNHNGDITMIGEVVEDSRDEE